MTLTVTTIGLIKESVGSVVSVVRLNFGKIDR